MKNEEEDVGIGVDFDQCAEEISFYTSCLDDRGEGDGNISRADSAVCLQSARDPNPAVLQKFNGSRRDHHIRTFHDVNVKRCQAYRVEMERQRNGTDSYLLTQQRLSVHLIDFIDLPLKKNTQRRIWTDRVTSPLYSMSDGGLEVNNDYFFPMESPFANIQKSYLRTLADSLSRTHRKLVELIDFVEQCEERSQLMLPMLIATLSDWTKEFLRDYTQKLDDLRAERLVDPLQALARLTPFTDDVEIVRAMIGDDVAKQIWLWEDIEKSWNRIFLLTQHEAISSKRHVVGKLQKRWMTVLLATMDHIFEVGRVPSEAAHFVLHNDVKPEAELLLCRNFHSIGSLLWDEELVETILEAVKCRVRIGIIEFPSRTFTRAFHSLLSKEQYLKTDLSENEILRFDEFRSIFMDTCVQLKNEFADELLAELHQDGRFVNLWTDLENVVIGSISHQYATTVFRTDSNVTNFSDAFWLASRGRMSKENMLVFSWIARKSEFSCKLDHLMSSFIRPELLDVMNQCMRFAHSAYRTRELLVTMANDKDLMSRMTCPQSSLDVSILRNQEAEYINRTLRIKLRFFVFTLEKIVSHFREMFADKVRYVFQTKRQQIVNAKSLKEVETAVEEGYRQLTDLVIRTGIRKMVHETMDTLLMMTDEIRLRSVSNTLDLEYLNHCQEVVRRKLKDLVALHASMGNDKDSIFYHLSMAAEYKNGSSAIRSNLKKCAEDILYIHQNNKRSDANEDAEFRQELMEHLADMMEMESEAARIEEIYEKINQNLKEMENEIPDDKKLQEMWKNEEKAMGKKKGGERKHFKDLIKSIRDTEPEEEKEDEEMEVMQVQHSRKDPISKKDIENPVINRKCGHVYDRDSIVEFAGKKKQINCAIQGCSQKITVASMEDYPEYWNNVKQQH